MYETELCEIFHKYFSDKCPQIAHSYSPKYFEILKSNRLEFSNILEIGIGNNELMKPLYGSKYEIGASLRAWRDFFINARIYGLDIRKDVLFAEDRIECFYTDQSKSEALTKTISEVKDRTGNQNLKFDLIIDDGSHIVEHMILTFEALSKYVANNGYYIIEDIKEKDLDIFSNLKQENFEVSYIHQGNNYWDSFVAYKRIST